MNIVKNVVENQRLCYTPDFDSCKKAKSLKPLKYKGLKRFFCFKKMRNVINFL